MRIATLFLLSEILAASLMVLTGTGVYIAYREYSDAYDADRFAYAVSTDVYQLTALTGDYILHFSDRAAAQWTRKGEALDQLLSSPKFVNTELEGDILKLQQYHIKSGQLFARSVAARGKRPQASTPTLQETTLLAQLQTIMQVMASEAARFSQRHNILMADAKKKMLLFGGAFIGLMPFLFIVLWMTLASRVIKPIQVLREGIDQFGQGQLNFRFAPKRGDEIGDVAAAFDDMASQLHTTMASRDELNQEIAERKRVEEHLLRSQRMEAVGQLTGGIAHDFNNMLAVMLGNVEILELMVKQDPAAQKKINILFKTIDRAASLTHRLLAFSRRQPLTSRQTNIKALIADLEEMLHRTLGETITLNIKVSADLWRAMIDGAQLDHALLNLALNAKDAMPQGGYLTIEAVNTTLDEAYARQQEEVTPGDYIKISVSDSGQGITPEVLEKVFEPFYTTKGVGEGSGLGLSMVYGFVKQSGGHTTIYSEVGHGTTVKLYLPQSSASTAIETVNTEPLEFANGSARILVVEDDPNVLEVSAGILHAQGYEIVEAGDSKEALQYLKDDDQTFDLLFTDVVLPGGMNGVEIAAEAFRLQPGIKVLYTSGYAETAVIHSNKLSEGEALVNKPYRRAELLEKVQTILDGKCD